MFWGWCPGPAPPPKQAIWSTTALYPILLGYRIAPCPTAPSSPHLSHGTDLQKYSSAAQKAKQQNLSLFLCCCAKPIWTEGWIYPFMHREKHSFLLLSSFKHNPQKSTCLHHLYPFLTLVFYALSGFSFFLLLPLEKCFIRDFFPRSMQLRDKHVCNFPVNRITAASQGQSDARGLNSNSLIAPSEEAPRVRVEFFHLEGKASPSMERE